VIQNADADERHKITAQGNAFSILFALSIHLLFIVFFVSLDYSPQQFNRRTINPVQIEPFSTKNEIAQKPQMQNLPIKLQKQEFGSTPARVQTPEQGGQSGSIAAFKGEENKDKIAEHGIGEGNPENRGIGQGSGAGTGTGAITEGTDIYRIGVENAPEAYGGIAGIIAKIPSNPVSQSLSGRLIYITAFIDEEGIVRKAHLSKGTGNPVDQLALSAVKRTRFKPGRDKGKLVKAQQMLCIQLP
jgi:TonB family protein